MIDVWIIEKLRQDKRKQQEAKRPVLQLPMPNLPCHPPEDKVESPPNRGVVIIDIGGSNEEED